MKLTPEELSQRAKDRAAGKKSLQSKLPPARLSRTGVILQLEAGDPRLIVRKRGDWRQDHCFPLWEREEILIYNPIDLAVFIRALCCRYNALVCDINAQAAGINLQEMKTATGDRP